MTSPELDHFLHQLIESMTTILGWTQLTMGSLPEDALQQVYLKRVRQAALEAAQNIQKQQRLSAGDNRHSKDQT